jgi:hypothetical protein
LITKFITTGAVAMLGLSLASCATQQQRMAALNAQDDSTCLGWGVQRGSQPYVECRAMLSQQRAAVDAQNSAAMMELSTTLIQAGQPH